MMMMMMLTMKEEKNSVVGIGNTILKLSFDLLFLFVLFCLLCFVLVIV